MAKDSLPSMNGATVEEANLSGHKIENICEVTWIKHSLKATFEWLFQTAQFKGTQLVQSFCSNKRAILLHLENEDYVGSNNNMVSWFVVAKMLVPKQGIDTKWAIGVWFNVGILIRVNWKEYPKDRKNNVTLLTLTRSKLNRPSDSKFYVLIGDQILPTK